MLLNLARALIQHYWLIWAATLIVVTLPVMFLSRSLKPADPVPFRTLFKDTGFAPLIPNVIWLGLFLSFLAFYIFAMYYGEDFAYYDHHIFTDLSLTGKNIRLQIRPHQSRFFPLGHQEWNLIQHVTRSPAGYQSFPVLELIVVLIGLWFLLRRYPVWLRLLASFVLVITPSIAISFFGLIYTERNVILWLVLFLFVIHEYLIRKGPIWLIAAALICVQMSIYYKEPVFLIFLGFSAVRVLAGFWMEKDGFRHGRFLGFFQKHAIDIGIIILCGVFLFFYFVIHFGRGMGYAEERDIGSFSALMQYGQVNLLLVIFLLTVAVRFGYLLYTRKGPDLFWDSLACGAILHFLAYVKLGMFRIYYTAPTDLIAILYLSRLAYSAKEQKVTGYLMALLLPLLIVQNAILAFHHVADRKNVIAGTVQLGKFLKDYAAKNSSATNLYFPYVTKGWHLQAASSYWSYKGVPLRVFETGEQTSSGLFTIHSPLSFPDNRCVAWDLRYPCFHAPSPQPNDLIVVLPGNGLSPERLNRISAGAAPLFCYKPELPGVQSTHMDACVFLKK